MDKPLTPADHAAQLITQYAEDWIQTYTPEKLQGMFAAKFDALAERLLLEYIGLKFNGWSYWELDRTRPDSLLTQHLQKHVDTHLDEWIQKINMPKLTIKMKQSIESAMRADFQRLIKNDIERVIHDQMKESMHILLEELTSTDVIAKYTKLHNLLKEEPCK